MKWIGQHIYDLVSRFRNDVYLEDITTSTENDIVVVNSEGKVSKRAASGLTVGTATLASTVEIIDSTANASYPVVFNNEVGGLRDDTGALFYNPSTGTLTTPNLTVSGTTTTINTTNLTIEDKNIILNYNASSDTSSTADGAGITIQDAVDASNDASLTWTAADDTFEFSHAVEINNGASGGAAALTIDNDDVDQIALDVDALNTTSNIIDINAQALTTGDAIFIDANSLTTGSALKIDIDDAQTSTNLIHYLNQIDYNKSGVIADGSTRNTFGLKISMIDAATNHANSNVMHVGCDVALYAASSSGTLEHVNFQSTNTGSGVVMKSFSSLLNDSNLNAFDFYAKSSALALAGQEDYFYIRTGLNGATTLATVDYSHALAHMTIEADGDITLDAAGDIYLESTDKTYLYGRTLVVENNVSSHGTLLNINDTNNSADEKMQMIFQKDKGAAGADGDSIFGIYAKADNSAQQLTNFASINTGIITALDGNEAGGLALKVATSNDTTSTLQNGLLLVGHGTNNDIDATLGYGSTSVTTVAGTLTMGTTATLDNSGNLLTNAATATALTSGDKTIEGNLRIGGSGDTSNNWITIDAQNGTDTTGGGICFYETGTDTIGAPQYGAKIVYNEDDDELAIGTMQNGVFQRQIHMERSWDNITLANTTYIEGITPSLALSDTSTTVADTDIIGTIWWRNSDDGAATARIQAVATEDHASGANGGTKLEFKTTPNTTSSEVTALTIGQDQSLTVAGDLTVNGDKATFESANADDPIVTIKNTSNDTNDMASLKFVKDRGAAPTVGTNLAEIYFMGEDSNQAEQEYGRILCEIDVATHGQESGALKFGVANHDGDNGYGLVLTGGSVNSEVDVTVGLGSASVTTIAGNLDIDGNTITTAGNIEIATGGSGSITLDAAGDIILESGGADVTSDAQNFTISNGESSSPNLKLQSKKDDTSAAFLTFDKNRFLGAEEAGTADGDRLGTIQWNGTNNAMQLVNYANIISTIAEVTDTDEAGKLTMQVAASNGTTSTMQDGIVIEGTGTTRQANVTIGNAVDCTTTIAGTLTMGSTATLNNSGVLQVANQSNITGLGTITSGTWEGTDVGVAHGGTGLSTVGTDQILTGNGTGALTSEAGLTYGSETLIIGDDDDGSATIKRFRHSDDSGGNLFVRGGDATGTNKDGGNLALYAGRNTGSGDGGHVYIYTGTGGSSGTSLGSQTAAAAFFNTGNTQLYGDLIFEGGTPDAYETTLSVTDPTQDATITIPNQTGTMMLSGVATGNIIHYACPKYVAIYLFYMNTVNYWYTPPGYNTTLSTSASLDGTTISASYQARMANYIATRACKIKKVSMVFYQNSLQSGDLDLEWALVKWTPADDTSNTASLTEMTITNNDGAFTETDVHTLSFDVTDNAASTLAAKDCIAFCGRVTSGSSTVRNLVNGQITFEIELT